MSVLNEHLSGLLDGIEQLEDELAELRSARSVSSRVELAECVPGTVIRDSAGWIFECCADGWFAPGGEQAVDMAQIVVPVTVLWRPAVVR